VHTLSCAAVIEHNFVVGLVVAFGTRAQVDDNADDRVDDKVVICDRRADPV